MSASANYTTSPAPIPSPDLSSKLSQKTTLFGLKLWVIIGTSVGVFMVLMIILILSIWLVIARRKLKSMDTSVTSSSTHKSSVAGRGVAATPANFTVYSSPIPLHSREIKEVMILNQNGAAGLRAPVGAVPNVQLSIDIHSAAASLPHQQQQSAAFTTYSIRTVDQNGHLEPSRFIRSASKNGAATVGDNYSITNVDDGEHSAAANGINELQMQSVEQQEQQQQNVTFGVPDCYPELSHLGWGHWFTLRDMQNATQGFCRENVLGEGGYGIVYKGRLPNGSTIAVKSLLNNMNTGQAEKEFRVEMEAIGRARHKNLVKYLGYCIEGTHRMLVYEFVDNGSLEQWLHHHSHATDSAGHSQLTWDSRMKIVIGIAKALAYLHEALEPRVVHRDIKASNILLDSEWNAKLSDFGLAKLLESDKSHVTTRVMGTFGYVAPEYASSGILSEKSDVYSFGVLLLEVITGRDPVDYARPTGEVNLVDWLKVMVGNHRAEEVVDPRLSERPAPRVLKKVLLIALRCIDPESDKRPKMGHVVHMLESDSIPYREIAMTTSDWRPSEGR